jgi:hypothetical protein
MTETEQIEAIYQAYPRHIGKRIALKAIEKAVQRVSMLHTLLDGKVLQWDAESARRYLWKKAKEYALSPAGQKPSDLAQDFRPHPSTWFNQDRFYDDPAEWQKPNGSRNGNHQTNAAEGIARINQQVAQPR